MQQTGEFASNKFKETLTLNQHSKPTLDKNFKPTII